MTADAKRTLPDAPRLSPATAGSITALMLEYQAVNQHRKLIDDLIALGVTEDSFSEWRAVAADAGVAIPSPLIVNTQSFIRRVNRQLLATDDAPRSMSERQVSAAAKATAKAQRLKVASHLVAETIADMRAPFMQTHGIQSLQDIGAGYCADFADAVFRALEEPLADLVESGDFKVVTTDNFRAQSDGVATNKWDWALLQKHWGVVTHKGRTGRNEWSAPLTLAELDAIDVGHHDWIVCGKRHFDAECPNGATSLFGLPFFARQIQASLERSPDKSKLSAPRGQRGAGAEPGF